MKKSELRELIREQVRNLIKEASVSQEAYTIHNITKCGQDAAQSFIDDNKLDGKKLAAYVRQHSNSKEKYEVRDIIAGTGVGANVSFKNRFLKQFQESVVTEGDMTNQYDGFIISSNYPKKDFKFRYIKGINNVKVENEAIAKLMKKFGEARPNFIVNGFVKKGQWDMDKAEIFKESVLKETFIGPFVFTASTPDKELIAMYHGALDGFSNYKTGMKFSKADYKLAYQTIEKILQKKGVAITEASITEAKEYSFTFDYNTDPDDIEYIENLLKKARVNAYAEQGTFDDEMVIKAGDAIELRKAKKAIEADGFQINEADDPEAGEAAPYGSGYSKVKEGVHGMAKKLLKGIVDGDSSEAEGIKLSKDLADHYLNWISTSAFGKKNENLPLNMLINASFNWGIEKQLDPKLKKELENLKASQKKNESVVNEAIDIHNDESAMKALEDIAVNMTKWKGSEGAHYTDLLEKVIDFLKYGNHRTN